MLKIKNRLFGPVIIQKKLFSLFLWFYDIATKVLGCFSVCRIATSSWAIFAQTNLVWCVLRILRRVMVTLATVFAN